MLESKDPRFEFVNYYGNTSIFALRALRRLGSLADMKLLSVACLMPHLADYLGIFHTVHHNTMVETRLPLPSDAYPAQLSLHQCDLFTLNRLDVDCIISHAAIHCMNDTRYGNEATSERWAKPYRAAAKLRQIAGRTVPTIVSVSVNENEGLFDNNCHLAHDKFIDSFERAGFTLQDYYFDYVCGGIPQLPVYLEHQYRQSKTLPGYANGPRTWVIGNYYFA